MQKLVYLVPLAAAISLVYNASRYELRDVILKRGWSFFCKTMLFMLVLFAVLYCFSLGL
ncbi:hypothetical protein [Calycomorphotria hydatis]|uniref:Uncharacterized protein n=1 Tax=Calycomorphotria hydatis TaxID=2528027 RepID=A0A517TBB0_9PLAN|nr:hypothetical protein [Calycomorphotria hydatis]QDT65663.1 hypothetical protein V22_29220 [Calycomorphotria hydatis]